MTPKQPAKKLPRVPKPGAHWMPKTPDEEQADEVNRAKLRKKAERRRAIFEG